MVGKGCNPGDGDGGFAGEGERRQPEGRGVGRGGGGFEALGEAGDGGDADFIGFDDPRAGGGANLVRWRRSHLVV